MTHQDKHGSASMTSEQEVLKPCPFCGESLIYEGGYLDWFTHAARSKGEKCIAHNINIVRSRTDRHELWNRRSPEPRTPAPGGEEELQRQLRTALGQRDWAFKALLHPAPELPPVCSYPEECSRLRQCIRGDDHDKPLPCGLQARRSAPAAPSKVGELQKRLAGFGQASNGMVMWRTPMDASAWTELFQLAADAIAALKEPSNGR